MVRQYLNRKIRWIIFWNRKDIKKSNKLCYTVLKEQELLTHILLYNKQVYLMWECTFLDGINGLHLDN